MIKLSNKDTNILARILKDEENKNIVINLLEFVLEKEIEDYYEIQIINFENISEYEFSLIKIKVKIFNEKEVNVYFRIINRDKIKETIFCYWYLLCEMKKKDGSKEKINSVQITETESIKCKNSVILKEKDSENGILKYKAEAHFIDFFRYIEINKSKKSKIQKLIKLLNIKKDKLLLIGMSPNEE